MRRSAVLAISAAVGLMIAGPAWATTRQASIGNYYYEDDATGSRTRIAVKQGDQITFTVREGVYPPHTVDVDELNIHSPGLLLGETFTTPPLNRAGTFRVYCRPHEDRGHVSSIVVQAATVAATSAPPAPPPTAGTGAAVASTPSAAVSSSPVPTPAAALAPVGVGKASSDQLRRPVAADPDSLEGLTGRARSTQPWTRALWFLLIASVPVIGAAGIAVSRELARGTSPSSPGPPRSPARSPRSSGPKASGSGRTSRGRRR